MFFYDEKAIQWKERIGFYVVSVFFYLGFIWRKFRIHKTAVEGEASFLTPPFNFHLLHIHLAGPLLQRAQLYSLLAVGPRLGN